MRYKKPIILIAASLILFASWELIGHVFLMSIPMGIRHSIDIIVSTSIAIFITAIAIQSIRLQDQEVQELARLRDYLLRMQAHCQRLSPQEQLDPTQQLEYRALLLENADIQQRLASDDPAKRAAGSLDLLGLAQTRITGMPKPYPFFSGAAAPLAAALYVETAPKARAQALYVLEAMVTFAIENDPGLVDCLIDDLAHANRTTFAAMIGALVKHFESAAPVSDAALRSILPFFHLTNADETNIEALRDLLDCAPFQEAHAVRQLHKKAENTQIPGDAGPFNAIQLAGTALRDTRDALARALRALPVPNCLPDMTSARTSWKSSKTLSLTSCYLVGADLNKAHLEGADMRCAYLQSANLSESRLQYSNLSYANLRGAQLFASTFDHASLWEVNLRDASLPAASLAGADLSRSHLQGARLMGANLSKACLWQVEVSDDKQKLLHTAVFTDANWWEAIFTDRLSGSTDKATQAWLRFTFPQPKLETDIAAPINPFTHA